PIPQACIVFPTPTVPPENVHVFPPSVVEKVGKLSEAVTVTATLNLATIPSAAPPELFVNDAQNWFAKNFFLIALSAALSCENVLKSVVSAGTIPLPETPNALGASSSF